MQRTVCRVTRNNKVKNTSSRQSKLAPSDVTATLVAPRRQAVPTTIVRAVAVPAIPSPPTMRREAGGGDVHDGRDGPYLVDMGTIDHR